MSKTEIPHSYHEENKENVTLIWLDPKIGSNGDTNEAKKQLHKINNYVLFHTELESCLKSIQSFQDDKIFVIISGKSASEVLPRITCHRQVDSIFIFCMNIDRHKHLTD